MVTSQARAREAPLPEPRPDPAHPRQVGEQIRRALGSDADRAQERTGRKAHGEVSGGRVQLAIGTPRRCSRSSSRRRPSACGRRSRSRAARRVQLRRGDAVRLDARARVQRRRAGGDRNRRGREPGGRPAASPGPELQRAVERRRQGEGTSRVTWEIEQVEDSCRLTVIHDQLREGANSELYGGWPMILSGLKTLLETGESLTTPGSLRYSGAAARR